MRAASPLSLIYLSGELSAAQDETIKGNVEATAIQQRVIADIRAQLSNVPRQVWKDASNRNALIKYVLSGGDPVALEKLLTADVFTPEERPLAEGAAAFARGDRAGAAQRLIALDPYRQSPRIAGLLALVQAVLISEKDVARALQRSDDARLLSPGSLVEESAWRMAIELAISSGNRPRFETSAVRYILRFPDSLYASEVLPRIARVMGGLDFAASEKGRQVLSVIARQLGPRQREPFFFEFGSAALRAGKLSSAKFAGKAARSALSGGEAANSRGQAIELAAMIVSERSPDVVKALHDFDPARSDPAIADLIKAARSLNENITRPLSQTASPSRGAAPPTAKDAKDSSAAKIAKLKSKLSEADELLLRSQQ